ncbi:MAG: ankyrin repeat domain-containing protein [Pseudomonadota bacterium]|nr:ankyrin repeat domain-containing protein [Pseudomonadota bacterium]
MKEPEAPHASYDEEDIDTVEVNKRIAEHLSRLRGICREGVASDLHEVLGGYSKEDLDLIFADYDNAGHNMLHIAIDAENDQIVKYLLDLGINPKAPTKPPVVLDENGDVAAEQPEPRTPLEFALKKDIDSITTLIYNKLDFEYLLITACQKGLFPIFDLICNANEFETLAKGREQINGRTLLHNAVMGRDKNLPFVKELFEKFNSNDKKAIFLNTPDDEGKTPLYYAFAAGDKKLIDELCAQGADLTATVTGDSALHIACRNGDLARVKYFLEERPTEVAKLFLGNNTPYCSAVDAGHVEIQEMLLSFLDTKDMAPLRLNFVQHLLEGDPAKVELIHDRGLQAVLQVYSGVIKDEMMNLLHTPDERRRNCAGVIGKFSVEIDRYLTAEIHSARSIFLANLQRNAYVNISNIPDANVKREMFALYNDLHKAHVGIIVPTNPAKRQEYITHNNKVLCLTRQLSVTAARYLRPGPREAIAVDFQTKCAVHIYNDTLKLRILRVITAILMGVFCGTLGFFGGLSAGPIGGPFGGIVGAGNGALMGTASAAATVAAITGGGIGVGVVNTFSTTYKLQNSIGNIAKACKKSSMGKEVEPSDNESDLESDRSVGMVR